MSKNNSTSSHLTFEEVLALIFITLKLTGIINWSWWWVLSPLWIGFIIVIVLIIIRLFIY